MDYLQIARKLQDACDAETFGRVAELGETLRANLTQLGDVLSLMDQFGTCSWGCKGAPHTAERFAARLVSYSLSTVRLLGFGHYDEAYALTRTLGEMANLLLLCAGDRSEWSRWQSGSDQVRRNEFGAGAVRKALGARALPIAMDRDWYAEMSARYAHSGQRPESQMHNDIGIPTMGGHLQVEGFRVGVFQLCVMVAVVTMSLADLAPIEAQRREEFIRAAEALGNGIPGVTLHRG